MDGLSPTLKTIRFTKNIAIANKESIICGWSLIKKELDKQGIQVSGKSPSILKDIYMYSQLCGINIKRE